MKTALAFVALGWLLVGTQAIFEEQAGLIDWHAEQLGQVSHAKFAFRGRERVFVGTKKGGLASLDTKDGSIVWRQVLEVDTEINDLDLVPRPASAVTLSHNSSVLRAWQALDGSLLWEKAISKGGSQTGGLLVLPDVAGDTSSKIAVYSGHQLEVLSASNGKRVWINEDVGGNIGGLQRDSDSQDGGIVVAVSSERGVYTLRLDAKTGARLDQLSFHHGLEDAAISPKHSAGIVEGDKFVWQAHGVEGFNSRGLSALLGKEVKSAALKGFVSSTAVSLLVNEQLALVDLQATELSAQSFPGFQVASAVAEADHQVAMAGVTEQGGLVVTVWNSVSKSTSNDYAIDAKLLASDGQEVLKVRSISARAKASSKAAGTAGPQFRILVEASDDSVWMLDDGKVSWHREEALASIQDTFFVDLPASTAEVASTWTSYRPSLMERMNAEVLLLKKTLGYSQPEDDHLLKDITMRMSTNLYPYRDANGFRKLIIALTSSGKLFGLHSGQGRIVWQTTLGLRGNLKKLLLWQSPLDPLVAPKVLALGTSGGRTHAVVVDTHTGDVLSSTEFSGTLQQVLHLPHTLHVDKAEQPTYALIFEDLSIQLLPATDEVSVADDQPIHFWVNSGDRLSGHKVASWGENPTKTWELAFSAPQNSLLKLIAPDPEEPVYSYAKVLGNRDMKLKYLKRNIVFAISGTQEDSENRLDSLLTAQLIDTISGQVLYSQSLQGARGPVSGIWSENWVVYSYYSIANQRVEVAVLEFYEAQRQAHSIPSLLFGQQNASYSSFAPVPLQVLHQSYWAQQGIRTMAITSTHKGITSKQILLGTESGQVYLMDKRFVDPRRPKGTPSKEEQAEMLPPYTEELMFVPSNYATHKEIIEGLSGISTAPANLESTTLVLAYGLDLFFTKIQPSKTFDLLPDDFPYAMLVLVVVALLLGSFVLKRVDERSSVKRKWT